MDEQELATLVEDAKGGRLEAFNQLVSEYQTPVYNLAFRMLTDPAGAEDVAQDTFVAAFRKIHTFHTGNFRAWLMRIAANSCRDHLRSARVRRSVSLEALEESPSFVVQDTGGTPESHTLRRELAGMIQETLGRLPADQRMAVVLVDVQEYSYGEAAQIMGVPIGTVKSRLSRGRLTLRDHLLAQRELLPGEYRLG